MQKEQFQSIIISNFDSLLNEKRIIGMIMQFLKLKGIIKYPDIMNPVLEQAKLSDEFVEQAKSCLDDWINTYRELFKNAPKGNIGNKLIVKQNMSWFITTTGYDKDVILMATENYINDCITNQTWAKSPERFIWTRNDTSKNKKSLVGSQLYEYIQRIENDNISKTVNSFGKLL